MSLVISEINQETKVATITFNRPEALNAMDISMSWALNKAILALADYDDLRCIVLKGNGRAFMAGGDVMDFGSDFSKSAESVKEVLEAINPIIDFFSQCDVPVIACVHGAVAGGALGLMASSDIVLAEEDTRFLIAYDKIATPPDCGVSYLLPRIIGDKRFTQLMLLGETWSAKEALNYGLITQVIEKDKFEEACVKTIDKIASGPTLAYKSFKQLLRSSKTNDLNTHLEKESELFQEATHTLDFRSGITGFINKTKAEYQGR